MVATAFKTCVRHKKPTLTLIMHAAALMSLVLMGVKPVNGLKLGKILDKFGDKDAPEDLVPTEPPLDPTPPTVPPPPSDVGVIYPMSECGNVALVTWKAPSMEEIDSFAVKCESGGDRVVKLVGSPADSALIGPLDPGLMYSCSVTSKSEGGTSVPASSDPFRTTFCIDPPLDVTTNIFESNETQWSVTWKDISTDNAEETYSLVCTDEASVKGCQANPVAFTEGIPRGVQEGRVTGLPPNSNFDCYVVAVTDSQEACSEEVKYSTGPEPPRSVTLIEVGNEPLRRRIFWLPPPGAEIISNEIICCLEGECRTVSSNSEVNYADFDFSTIIFDPNLPGTVYERMENFAGGKYDCSVSVCNEAGLCSEHSDSALSDEPIQAALDPCNKYIHLLDSYRDSVCVA